MRVLCGYIDLNTRICGSTRIYAGIVATLSLAGQPWGSTGVFFQPKILLA